MSEPIAVLHVDDDPDFVDLTATYLERSNGAIEVTPETDPAASIDRLADGAFDCIVSDYEMPELNGIELLERVREDHPELPFILFTGRGSEEVASEAISAGVTDYLQKESGTEQYAVLANRIDNAVERVQAKRERRRHLDAIETAQEGISILDEDGRFVYVNEAYADLYGYEPAELLGEHWGLIFPDEDVPWIREELLPHVRDTGQWHGTTTGLRADGTTFAEDHVLATTEQGALVCTVRDASDRAAYRRELKEEQAFIQQAIDTLDDLFYVVDTDGSLSRWNDRVTEVTGHTDDEIEAMSALEFFPPEEHDRVTEAIQETYATGRSVLEADVQTADGSRVPFEFTGSRLTDLNGDLMGLVGVGRDLSKRAERERDLDAAERRFDAVFNNPFAFMALLEPDGTVVDVNDTALDFVDRSHESVRGTPFWETPWWSHSAELQADLRSWIERAAAGELVRFDAKHYAPDGERAAVDGILHPIRDDAGDVVSLLAAGRDVSERTAYERRIEQLHETARALIEADSPEAIADLAVEAAQEVLGLSLCSIHLSAEDGRHLEPTAYTDELVDIVGDPPPAMHPGDGLAWQVFESGDPRVYDDVSTVPGRLTEDPEVRSEIIQPLRSHGVFIASSTEVGVFDEMTVSLAEILVTHVETALDRLEHEHQLQLQNERLDEFASVVSHDLRSPLNVAEGRLELAMEDCTSEHLDHIAETFDRMHRLIDDVLWLAREGRDVGETGPVDLQRAAEEAWATVADAAGGATLSTVASDARRLPTVTADEGRLLQLFENLFRNAIDHAGSDVSVRVESTDGGFAVEDDGPGVPEEDQDRIFDAGYSTTEDGTGFGLNIVEQIAEAHGWTITVTTASAGGARFEFTGVAVVDDAADA